MRKPTPKLEQAREYIRRFQGSPKQAIARALNRDFPELYETVESARDAVRYLSGAHGEKVRAFSDAVEIGHQSATFARMPEGIRDIDDFAPFVIEPGRTLVLNDLHIPFHDRAAIEIAVKWGKKRKPDTILINGDLADCYAQSKWETDPRKRKLKNEVAMIKQFFGWMRKQFPDARFVWKFGNHEERHERYVMVRCPELLDMPMMQLDKICGASEFGIETVREMQPIKLGNLYALHGHEYKFAISNPVNPARGLYLRAKKSTICGHFHQESSHTESDISDDITTCWSVACLCDLHPRYMPLNKWSHGCADVEHNADGSFRVDNKRIFKGAML